MPTLEELKRQIVRLKQEKESRERRFRAEKEVRARERALLKEILKKE